MRQVRGVINKLLPRYSFLLQFTTAFSPHHHLPLLLAVLLFYLFSTFIHSTDSHQQHLNSIAAIMTSTLFKPVRLGNIQLQHRIAMAPLTRFRADDAHVPTPMMVEYYTQRASAPGTLLITEATYIAHQAGGYPKAPGIWSQAQIDGWKTITDAVHKKGSFMYLQLWALGRVANLAQLQKEIGPDVKVVGAGDIAVEGGVKPTPLTEGEIKEYVGLYAQAAKNAIAAGFDGVEIHGANGYLVDQFLQDVTNNRTDKYGGSVENRARFGIEVATAVVEAVGAEKTGIRLSPYSNFQGMLMEDPKPQFTYFTSELKKLKLSYIHLTEERDATETSTAKFLIDLWDNQSPVLLCAGWVPETAKKLVDEEYKDKDVIAVIGKYFISNPDLVYRIEKGLALTKWDRDLFYNAGEAHGYTDWEFSKEFTAQL
jgi:NADPH2 dehydrogenase